MFKISALYYYKSIENSNKWNAYMECLAYTVKRQNRIFSSCSKPVASNFFSTLKKNNHAYLTHSKIISVLCYSYSNETVTKMD